MTSRSQVRRRTAQTQPLLLAHVDTLRTRINDGKLGNVILVALGIAESAARTLGRHEDAVRISEFQDSILRDLTR